VIRVRVNGEERELTPGTDLRSLVLALGFHPEAVAVALNGDVVRRARLAEVTLAGGEVVEIIRAVGGG
jgi:sulfur carrier protein